MHTGKASIDRLQLHVHKQGIENTFSKQQDHLPYFVFRNFMVQVVDGTVTI
jgi:hypothetical protein